LRNYKKKTMGSSEDPSLINNVDELGLVYQGLNLSRAANQYNNMIPHAERQTLKILHPAPKSEHSAIRVLIQ